MPEEASSQIPKTRWSLALQLGSTSEPQRQIAFEQLCQHYWKPLYSYARRRGLAVHDAEDLTQGFLGQLLARGSISHLDPAKGRLRSFLKAAFQNFIADQDRRAFRQKRGGYALESLDLESAEKTYQRHLAQSDDPDLAFDQHWARIILHRALSNLRARFEARNRSATLRELEIYLANEDSAPSYAIIGERLGLSENAVAAAVARMRQEFATLLRQEIASTLNPHDEIEEELRYLLRVVS